MSCWYCYWCRQLFVDVEHSQVFCGSSGSFKRHEYFSSIKCIPCLKRKCKHSSASWLRNKMKCENQNAKFIECTSAAQRQSRPLRVMSAALHVEFGIGKQIKSEIRLRTGALTQHLPSIRFACKCGMNKSSRRESAQIRFGMSPRTID